MNPKFFPNPGKESKPGLERNKQLKRQASTNKADKKLKANIPSGWIYNEKNMDKMWNDLEYSDFSHFQEPKENPYVKIDESTNKIRNVISNYEHEDAELLMKMAEINSPDGEYEINNDDTIMMDAKTRLVTILDDHSGLASQQSDLLDSLQEWFRRIKNGDSYDPDFLKQEELKQCDLSALQEVLNELEQEKNTVIDKASDAYQSMVESLTKKVNECKSIIAQKELEISQLKEAKESKKLTRRRSSRVSDSVTKLVKAQMQNENLKQQLNQLYQERQLNESQKQQQEDLKMPGSTGNEEYDDILGKNFELNGQLKVINGQLNDSKEENKYLKQQIFKLKQSEMVQLRKIQQLEKRNETLEKTVKNTEEKMKLTGEIKPSKVESGPDQETLKLLNQISDLKKKHSEEIDQIKENTRIRIDAIQKDCDNRLKETISQLSEAFQGSDTSSIVNSTIQIYNQKMTEQQEQADQKFEEYRAQMQEKYRNMITEYERMLAKKDEEIEEINKKQEEYANYKMKCVQLDYDEKLNQQVLELQQKSFQDYSQLQYDLSSRIDELKRRLKKATRENKTLKSFLEANALMPNLQEEEEEEDENEFGGESSDGVLSKSLAKMKEMDLEKKLSEKYDLLMQTQSSMMREQKDWELQAAKKASVEINRRIISEFRVKAADATKETILRVNSSSDAKLKDYFVKMLKLFDKGINEMSGHKDTQILVPADEVEFKLESMRTKLLSLLNENEIWKLTFDKIEGIQDKTTGDILEALKLAIETQAKEKSILQEENSKLKERVKKLEDTLLFSPEKRRSGGNGSGSARSDSNENQSVRGSRTKLVNMKLSRQFIFQVNPGTRRHFFVKLEGTPALPEGHIEFDCSCANCKEGFIFRSKDVRIKSVDEPFVMCPKCRNLNQIMCIDHAMETGHFSEYVRRIKQLEFRIRVLEQNQRNANDTASLNLKDKAINLFIDLSKSTLNSFIKSGLPKEEAQQRQAIILEIGHGISDLSAAPNVLALNDIMMRARINEDHGKIINDLLEILNVSSSAVSAKKVQPKANVLPELPLSKIQNDQSSSRVTESKALTESDQFEFTPPPSQKSTKSGTKQSGSSTITEKSSHSSRSKKSAEETKFMRKLDSSLKADTHSISEVLVSLKKQVLTMKSDFVKFVVSSRQEFALKMRAILSQLGNLEEMHKKYKEARKQADDLEIQLKRAADTIQLLQINMSSNQDLETTMKKMQSDYESKINTMLDDYTKLKEELNKAQNDLTLKENMIGKLQTSKLISQHVSKVKYGYESSIIFSLENQDDVPVKERTQKPQMQQEPENATTAANSSSLPTPKNGRPSSVRGDKTPRMVLPKSRIKKVVEQKPAQLIVYDGFNVGSQPDESGASNVVVVTHMIKEDRSKMQVNGGSPETPLLTIPTHSQRPSTQASSASNSSKNTQRSPMRPKTPLQTMIRETTQNTARMKMNEDATEVLTRRVQALEQEIQNYAKKLEDARNKLHELQTKEYKTKTEASKLVVALNKEKMMHASAATRLNKAVLMIEEKNRKIEELKKINNNFNSIAAEIAVLNCPTRKKKNESEINRILSVFTDTPGLEKMAENEFNSLQKWMEKRDKIVQKEQNRIIKVLDALCLILPEKGGRKENQPLLQVTSA